MGRCVTGVTGGLWECLNSPLSFPPLFSFGVCCFVLSLVGLVVGNHMSQVSRFMAAASHSFESLPLTTITQNVMLEVRRSNSRVWGVE